MVKTGPLSYEDWQKIGAKLRNTHKKIMCSKCYVTIITDEEGWYFPQTGDFYCPFCWIKEHED